MRRCLSCLILSLLFLLIPLFHGLGHAGEEAGKGLTLEELEALALRNNPSIAQAAAGVESAEGRRVQAGLYPNPMIGYIGEDITARAPGKTSKHYLFYEQTFVTDSKLGHRSSVFELERAQEEIGLDARKQRVLSEVRSLFYEVLGAERLVLLKRELADLAREAVGTSEELYNIGQADRPDVLSAEIEAQQARLSLIETEGRLERVRQALAAAVGLPSLPETTLSGSLESDSPEIDREGTLERLLEEGPQVRRARTGIERQRAALRSAEAERVPDITLRIGLGYNLEEWRDGGRTGAEGFLELGLPLPLFNRNQGAIASAEAELARAKKGLEGVALELRASFSSAYAAYRSSLSAAETYRKEILPKAEKAHEMYRERFRQMAASYPQVLIAKKTLLQLQVRYTETLVELRKEIVRIRGMLLTKEEAMR